ncbi:MAG: rhodanese-like domain-containing protein [Lachnospiraceae bacterium]|nr:rhodanese-like domain-containing protein [Lachnospiraceae bacterium]
MKINKSLLISLISFKILLMIGCGTNEKEEVGNEMNIKITAITAMEAFKIMESGEEFILLDVRSSEEYREKHIAGAILIPDNEIANRAEKELPDKNAKILVYCRSGKRSEAAANKLAEMGYLNVLNFGGINDWPYGTVGE